MQQFNTWVISPLGDGVNLQYTAQVIWGGNLPAASAQMECEVILVQTGNQAPAVWTYNSANLAFAASVRLKTLLLAGGAQLVTGSSNVSIGAIDTASAPHGVANTIINLTGTGFSQNATVTIDGVEMSAASTDGAHLRFVLDVTIPAGTYDVEYTDASGNAAVMVGGITLT